MPPNELPKTTAQNTRALSGVDSGSTPETQIEFELAPGNAFADAPGSVLGNYTLVERLGEGGFGTVWKANQVAPVQRTVALKLLKPGMDSREIVSRFAQERQALAVMDHPGIAKVLDAGTTPGGRPFFVMELVRGQPFNSYCDERHLSTRDRLQLFIQVCLAVQHAHQKGVIHRDLKSSNILVCDTDEGPQPKVIDFGIAKAVSQPLTDDSLMTQAGQFIGTPAYMSPEQAEGLWIDLDTRSDVYSLGVILYQLLTGLLPFDSESLRRGGLDAFRRQIREQTPARPSTRLRSLGPGDQEQAALRRATEFPRLVQTVRGDLDWIIMKALEKDRARRYDTAQDFAADIRRFIQREPVLARPPSPGYLFRRFVARNRLAVTAAAIVMATLIVGLAVSVTLFLSERTARSRAETALAKANQVAKLWKEMLVSAGPSKAQGRDATMLREILDNTAAGLSNELAGYPDVESELRTTLGSTYEDLLEYRRSQEQHRLALDIRRRHLPPSHPLIADSLFLLASASDYLDELDTSYTAVQEAIAINRRLGPDRRNAEGDCHDLLAWVLYRKMDLEAAQAEAELAIEIFRAEGDTGKRDLAQAMDTLGTILLKRGRFYESEQVHRETVAQLREVLGPMHPKYVTAINNLCHTLIKVGKYDEVETRAREALILTEKISGKPISDLTDSLHKALAEAKAARGDFPGAIADMEVAVAAATEMYGADHRFTIDKRSLLAQMQIAAGQLDAAEATLERTRDLDNRESAENSLDVAQALLELARGNLADALQAAESAVRVARGDAPQPSVEMLDALRTLAQVQLARNDRKAARLTLDQALQILDPQINSQTPIHRQLTDLLAQATAAGDSQLRPAD